MMGSPLDARLWAVLFIAIASSPPLAKTRRTSEFGAEPAVPSRRGRLEGP